MGKYYKQYNTNTNTSTSTITRTGVLLGGAAVGYVSTPDGGTIWHMNAHRCGVRSYPKRSGSSPAGVDAYPKRVNSLLLFN